MKKFYFYFALLIFTFSCNKNKDLSGGGTWNAVNARENIDQIYASLGNGGFDEQMLASLSDEALYTYSGKGMNILNEGNITASNTGWMSPNWEWGSMNTKIHSCNVGLEKIQTSNIDQSMKNQFRGETYFLRAYFCHQLLRFYGGFIIAKDANTDINSLARSSYEDCVNFIVNDCDSAVYLLNSIIVSFGRANSLAALALKSRVLLYAASYLHDFPIASSKSTLISSFSHSSLICYTTGSRVNRLAAAQKAASAVLNSGSGYRLTYTAPVSFSEAINNYRLIATGGVTYGRSLDGVDIPIIESEIIPELIFSKFFTNNKDEIGNHVGLYNGPNGYHNKANNTPTGLLVDNFSMIDGSRFSWSNPIQSSQPYKNRDPRFYVDILYDGANWKPRNLVAGNVDVANQIQTGQYQTASGILAGLDSRGSSIDGLNGSWTGYYMGKFIHPSPIIVDKTDKQFVPWPFLRYTEMVLNYAESCIGLGQEDLAKTWINKLRFRAGMPAVTSSGSALESEYQNEREIELAFEEHRYHDVRRWMIAPITLNRKLTYIKVTATLKPGATAPNPYRHDETIYNYTYTSVIDNSQENRTWNDKMYFLPISSAEMAKNKNLVQNPGY